MKTAKIIDALGQAKQAIAMAKNNKDEALKDEYIALTDKLITHALVLLTERSGKS